MKMKVINKEVRLNEDRLPVMVLTIEVPMSLGYEPQSFSDGEFYGALENAIMAFDEEARCSLTPKA
jgi:hypothetical protein